MSYFTETHTDKNKIEVELNLPNYTTKSDLKKQRALIHHSFLKKAN